MCGSHKDEDAVVLRNRYAVHIAEHHEVSVIVLRCLLCSQRIAVGRNGCKQIGIKIYKMIQVAGLVYKP